MGQIAIHCLLLCAIAVASVSEHPRLRAIVPCSSHDCYFSADPDESKFDNFELQALIAGQPLVGSDEFCCYSPVAATFLFFDSPRRNDSHLRGPPRFWLS